MQILVEVLDPKSEQIRHCPETYCLYEYLREVDGYKRNSKVDGTESGLEAFFGVAS